MRRVDDDTRSGEARTALLREPLIASASALIITLENLVSQGKAQLDRLIRLERAYQPDFGKLGQVAEAFAVAFAALGEMDKAIEWYRRSVEAPEGGASFRSLEQLCNLTIRRAAERVDGAYARWQDDREARAFESVVATAEKQIEGAVHDLERLNALLPTYERANLLASAWKRRAIIAELVERQQQSPTPGAVTKVALARMREGYEEAEELARAEEREDTYYATLNRMSAELIAGFQEPAFSEDSAGVALVQQQLATLNEKRPEFWTVAQQAELLIYQSLSLRQLEPNLEKIVAALASLYQRVSDPRKWASVRDQQRFTLRSYMSIASPAERQAATQLIELLEGYVR